MKACFQYAEELAGCAAMGRAPSRILAAHVQSCGECRHALGELRRVAAINTRVAGGLAEPSKSISLPSVFLRAEARRARLFKPFLWVAAATGCIAVFLAMSGTQKKADRAITLMETPGEQVRWEPTWQRLREGVDALPTGRAGGSVVAHYRVKDAYSDLN